MEVPQHTLMPSFMLKQWYGIPATMEVLAELRLGSLMDERFLIDAFWRLLIGVT